VQVADSQIADSRKAGVNLLFPEVQQSFYGHNLRRETCNLQPEM
jgi:hypothetical protein